MAKIDLSSILTQVGAPLLKQLVEGTLPPPFSDLGGRAVEVLADRLGAPEPTVDAVVERYQANPNVAGGIIKELEADPAVILAGVKQQEQTNTLLLAEMKEPLWTWAWRPAWMWGLLMAWCWLIFVVPLINMALSIAGLSTSLVMIVDITTLLAVTGIFSGLYMGGHTIKDFVTKKWGGA